MTKLHTHHNFGGYGKVDDESVSQDKLFCILLRNNFLNIDILTIVIYLIKAIKLGDI